MRVVPNRPLAHAAQFLLIGGLAFAQTLPGTGPLETSGDPAAKMIAGISAYLQQETEASIARRKPSRERLRYVSGVVDERVPFEQLELVASTARGARLAESAQYTVDAVRWPVLHGVTAEGLWLRPKKTPLARVVAIPDADQAPEQFGPAFRLAATGCEVLVPVLIDRQDTWSGNPRIRMTNQPHREFLYRMGFPVGRHIIGYEVQKAFAAVDWFARARPAARIGIWGYGEGGLVALYAAALDRRISAAVISGYFRSRQGVWKEPIYRNVWSLLRDFGDAELASLSAAHIVVDREPGPRVEGPPPEREGRRGAAPGALGAPEPGAIEAEVSRARALGARIQLAGDPAAAFFKALEVVGADRQSAIPELPAAPPERMHRQFQELVAYTQNLVRRSETVREEYWSKADASSPERWRESVRPYRRRIWDDMIGRLPAPAGAMHPRARTSYHGAGWEGYEVMLDVYPDVFSYGVLLVPKGIPAGERRPVVVAQHGLDGRAQDLFGQPEVDRDSRGATSFHFYQNIGSRLAESGFVVYLPQNPYIGDFRFLQRQANPLGLSLFSFILAQNERVLDWLAELPFVDSRRIGFYGLSYGGKTALRIPPLIERYALSICSGDFNEWVVKLATVEHRWSYMFTQEWEMGEWNLGNLANHAELASLMAPRPFMVERGHRDGVADDQWVAYEYAKVQRLYDEMGIGDRARIEYFNGPHMIHGKGTIEFLKRFLDWPR